MERSIKADADELVREKGKVKVQMDPEGNICTFH